MKYLKFLNLINIKSVFEILKLHIIVIEKIFISIQLHFLLWVFNKIYTKKFHE